jgi:hypothetical protein
MAKMKSLLESHFQDGKVNRQLVRIKCAAVIDEGF